MSEVEQVAASEDTGAESVAVDTDVGGDTSIDTSDTSVDTSDSVFDWNGEVESLREADWFGSIDEGRRDDVLKGIETKYQNWQRGYTKAFQENADRRKKLEERAEAVRAQEMRVQKWLHGDVDPLLEKQKEIDTLTEAHTAALEVLKKEHGEAVEALKGSSGTELEEAQKQLKEANTRISEFIEKEQTAAQADLDRRTDEFEGWLQKEAPDIIANDDAFYLLCVLCAGGTVTKEQAVKMVHAQFPAPAPEPVAVPEATPEPEPVPESMSLMNMGTGQGSGTASGDGRSFDDMLKAKRLAAMRENGGIFGG